MMSAVPAMPASVNGSRIVDDVAFTLNRERSRPSFTGPKTYILSARLSERARTLSTSKIEGG